MDFEEPLYYFNPAIAPSEIIILLSNVKAKSLLNISQKVEIYLTLKTIYF